MAETLQVQVREETGTRSARRVRRQGMIPAVLYGHGQDNVSLLVAAEQVQAALRHGGRFVSLSGPNLAESALIADIQWNTWGSEVLHVDFHRVSADERVEVTVPITLKGEAPGVKTGGMLQHLMHEIAVECAANAVPEALAVSVNHLELGAAITVKDLETPSGAKFLADPEDVVVQCVEPTPEAAAEEGAAEMGAVEPELIGRKKEPEEGEA